MRVIVYVGLLAGMAALLISAIRARRVKYRDISASEIHPDLAAAEDLLHEAAAELQHWERAVSHRAELTK